MEHLQLTTHYQFHYRLGGFSLEIAGPNGLCSLTQMFSFCLASLKKVIHRQFFLTENSFIFLLFALMENNAREWLIDCWKTSGHM
jgi:hypothetical protein